MTSHSDASHDRLAIAFLALGAHFFVIGAGRDMRASLAMSARNGHRPRYRLPGRIVSPGHDAGGCCCRRDYFTELLRRASHRSLQWHFGSSVASLPAAAPPSSLLTLLLSRVDSKPPASRKPIARFHAARFFMPITSASIPSPA